jgi:hypothetical protein
VMYRTLDLPPGSLTWDPHLGFGIPDCSILTLTFNQYFIYLSSKYTFFSFYSYVHTMFGSFFPFPSLFPPPPHFWAGTVTLLSKYMSLKH